MPQVTIIVLSFNTLKCLKECIASVLQYTDKKLYELLIIDQGSKDGSREYIKSLDCKYIFNEENVGYAAGCNQGIKASNLAYVCLLNSDAVVCSNWLEIMLRAGKRYKGIISPLVEQAITHQIPERRQGGGGYKFYPGVCWLIQREVIDKIGYLDEDFGDGLDEDRDYCDRILDENYTIYVCSDVRIKHYEHQTFINNNIDMVEAHKKNIAKLIQKPSKRKRIILPTNGGNENA